MAADYTEDEKHDELGPIEVPARISLLYESDDGRLCLFEDAEGHLTAVPAANLA